MRPRRWLLVRLLPGHRRLLAPGEHIDASLHADTDAICPDCLRWIRPDDYVRRNAFDLLEHEVCPPVSVRARLD